MKKHFTVAVAACLAMAVTSGCPAPNTQKTPVIPTTKSPSPSASTAAKALAGKSILGTVKLPTGYNVIATGGGNFVSTNGGTVVPTGGGNVISTGGGNLRTVLKVDESVAAGATVTLVDEDGDKVAGVASVKADADGNYKFSNVPEGTYKVEVEAEKGDKKATFETIVEAGDTNADVNAASTIVTAGVVQNLDGDLKDLEIDDYEKAVDKTEKTLETADLPDFTSDSAVLAKFDELSQEIAELKSLVVALSAKIDELSAKIEALTAQLADKEANGDCAFPRGMDANGDGMLSFAEFQIPTGQRFTKATIFTHLDVDKSSSLSLKEFCNPPGPPPEGQGGSPAPTGSQPPPPPPDGQQPPPPGDCGAPERRTFTIVGYTAVAGDRLQATRLDGSPLDRFVGEITGSTAVFDLPSNCPHKFKIVNGTRDVKMSTMEIRATGGQTEIRVTF